MLLIIIMDYLFFERSLAIGIFGVYLLYVANIGKKIAKKEVTDSYITLFISQQIFGFMLIIYSIYLMYKS